MSQPAKPTKALENGARAAGYLHLIDRYDLAVIPNWHESVVAATGKRRTESTGGRVRETYLSTYWPGEAAGDHLEFALKYDGLNLAILASVFRAMPVEEMTAYIASKPTGKYARRLWYLYEWITGQPLPLANLDRGNYVDLVDREAYFTADPARRIRRQRINDNLLGEASFCPTIRRTEALNQMLETDVRERCRRVVAGFTGDLLKRATSYLYTKETKSSFEIEHIQPSATRTERFIALLELAEDEDFCDKPHLLEVQARIVDPRFAADDYRMTQNYVGQAVAWQAERVHFACPKPDDLADLMAGLISSHQRMNDGDVHPVVHAGAVAYGFVFLHPFEDGNGRIHRFLIHNILARRRFTPEGLMFPISAAMLKHPGDYDASLEAFSKPLMRLVDYSLDDAGRMTVHNQTADWYRYIDLTAQVEALFSFIQNTIDTELVEELTFLSNYDLTKAALQEIVDMPDRQIDLFIRFCLQNHGRLSARKRASHFDFLTDEETAKMEQAVKTSYGPAA